MNDYLKHARTHSSKLLKKTLILTCACARRERQTSRRRKNNWRIPKMTLAIMYHDADYNFLPLFFSFFLFFRISVVFRVRSAQRIKISDGDLIKRLVVIVFVFSVYLTARTVAGTPRVIQGLSSPSSFLSSPWHKRSSTVVTHAIFMNLVNFLYYLSFKMKLVNFLY